MKFKINNKYSIIQFDDRNWAIERKARVNPEKRKKTPPDGVQEANTAIYGFYSTLETAKEAMAELCAKEAIDFSELDKWIKAIKSVTTK